VVEPKPPAANKPVVEPKPPVTIKPVVEPKPVLKPKAQPYHNWEGSWDLQFEYNGAWSDELKMTLSSDKYGIEGNYRGRDFSGRFTSGTLNGIFVGGNTSKVTGTWINTSNTGQDCQSGRQDGKFLFNLSADGRNMDGTWGVCGQDGPWRWRARKLN
jgi:hypothetical protein